MKEQNGKINENPRLTALSEKRQVLLDRLLKGKIPIDLKAKTIPKRKVFSPVPLSFAQKRLWVLDRLVPGNPFYNSPEAVPIKGGLDLAVFERSINEMIRRHESLRTIFKMENDEPVQVILPELHIKINVIDLSHLPAFERMKETQRFTAEEAIKPFDLERGPLLRVFVLVHAMDSHILFYNMHHIITDGWSIKVFNKEWEIIYRAFSAGTPCPLPEPSVQYADFALWQREWLQGEKLQKQLLYWKNILGGDIPILELPADRQRPAISSYRGRKEFFEIPGSLAVGLAELSLEEGCTMFMTMLAAFGVLLYRYSGQGEIMIGTPLASRTKPELEEIIGFFSNTLVIRTDLTGNPTFNQLLRRVRGITAGAYDNQDLPFERLVEELQPDRYMNHNPLFQVMLVLENAVKQTAAPGKENTGDSDLTADSGSAKFDLWLLIIQSEKSISCTLEYSTDLFDSDTIMRLLGHFKNLLEAIVRDPDRCIDDIPYLADEEKAQLLSHWNDTGKEYNLQPLHKMFEFQVKRTPDHIAVVGADLCVFPRPVGQVSLSYCRLNDQSDLLAGLLTEKGTLVDDIIGITIERSVEMVIGLMGILKSGGAYLPIDSELPQDRIDYMLKDSGAKLLIDETFFRGSRGAVLQKSPPCRANLAYLIYTSGSTGKPKGVMIYHEGISNRLQWMQKEYGLTTDDRILQKTPFSFDVSVWEFFWTLSTGARLVMAFPGGHKDSSYLIEVINKEQITTIHFVPTMLNVFLEDPAIRSIHSLKRVICSGEALPLEYQERFFKHFGPPAALHNLYGPTEASVDVTAWACERTPGQRIVPIGKPIANTQIYILDKNLNPVPVGVHGELHIGGIQLARGYINRPELTAEKFGPQITLITQINEIIKTKINKSFGKSRNPFSKGFLAAGGILYKTGDLARWLPDGTIEYIGRLDSQVKVRGFRIELGEIESNLREFESVSDAVVMVTEDTSDAKTKKLIAYIVPDMNYWQSYGPEDDLHGDLSMDQVATWQNVFDDAYTKDPGQEDPTFNIAGWNSSYTGAPIPAGEMRTWVDNTVERILSFKPQRVMEIGCGTGLFLFRVIPHCRMFIGTDISKEGLNYIENVLKQIKEANWAEVRTMQQSADNFEGIEPG
ncbi:MAG TPA: amino acid adenylation domain-containing protein, partial [Candidatus Deferrimicrobium sp.]|nr:amino acid adenylation domain-containing protein [Candidatus Deferrimicrobium sp.]